MIVFPSFQFAFLIQYCTKNNNIVQKKSLKNNNRNVTIILFSNFNDLKFNVDFFSNRLRLSLSSSLCISQNANTTFFRIEIWKKSNEKKIKETKNKFEIKNFKKKLLCIVRRRRKKINNNNKKRLPLKNVYESIEFNKKKRPKERHRARHRHVPRPSCCSSALRACFSHAPTSPSRYPNAASPNNSSSLRNGPRELFAPCFHVPFSAS